MLHLFVDLLAEQKQEKMKIIAFFLVCLAFVSAQDATTAPVTAAPATAVPVTAAPETAAPETAAPETEAPQTRAPETKAPGTEAPVVTTAAPGTKKPHHSKRPHTKGPHHSKKPHTKGPQKCGCICRYEGCMAITQMPKGKEMCFRFLKACAKRRHCTLEKCNGPLSLCLKKADGNPFKRATCIKKWVVCYKKNQKKICKKGGKGKEKKPE